MKTRNGFVSNSSSSSFLVTYKKVVDKRKVGSDSGFGELLESYLERSRYNYESELKADGKDRVLAHLDLQATEEYGAYDEVKALRQRVAALPDEDVPMSFTVSHHDQAFLVVLKAYQDKGYVTVLDHYHL
jgi:hypothetical protein